MISNGNKKRLGQKLVSGLTCLLLAFTPEYAFAIDAPAPAAPAAETPQTEAAAPQAPSFTADELEKLLAPIALFPDALLAQLLPATAYPLDIVQAQRWLDNNKAAVAKQDFAGGDAQDWDPSVKAMLRFPTLVRKLSSDLDWTQNLGDALVNQPQDVSNAIQALRAKAQQTGVLKTNDRQKVTTRKVDGREFVTIESADPSALYVPSYDPAVVYNPAYVTGAAVAAGLLTFGAAVAIGSAFRNNYWNWGSGAIYRGRRGRGPALAARRGPLQAGRPASGRRRRRRRRPRPRRWRPPRSRRRRWRASRRRRRHWRSPRRRGRWRPRSRRRHRSSWSRRRREQAGSASKAGRASLDTTRDEACEEPAGGRLSSRRSRRPWRRTRRFPTRRRPRQGRRKSWRARTAVGFPTQARHRLARPSRQRSRLLPLHL
jgi:hypothetical protein